MTDRERPEANEDLSSAPEYRQLGDEGNPFSAIPDEEDEAEVEALPGGGRLQEGDPDAEPPSGAPLA